MGCFLCGVLLNGEKSNLDCCSTASEGIEEAGIKLPQQVAVLFFFPSLLSSVC